MRRRSQPRRAALACALACALAFWVAPAPGFAQVLHERVVTRPLDCKDGLCPSESGVKAIEQDGQVIFAPGGGAQPSPGEQVFAPQAGTVEVGGDGSGGGGGGDRTPERRDRLRSDRETGPEGTDLHIYHAVFNPEIFPYKRMTALDGVETPPCQNGRPGCVDEVLVVRDRTQLFRLAVDLARAPARDAFWGSIVVDFEPGRWVPIPSVAADTHILEARTDPRVDIELARDGADNVFVRSSVGGRHRLIWLSDAPKSYFGGELPEARLKDVPAELRPTLPPVMKARARRVLERIGLRPRSHMTIEEALSPLVAYFRAFEVGTMPPPSESLYLDLALSQKGVCRHRSFAFAITAMAVGIPVRYLENEVHAYVEVYLPKQGWRRINLGGAPLNEEVVGGEGKTLYGERGGDPFPKPEAFAKGGGKPPKGVEKMARGGSGSGGGSRSGSGSGTEPETGTGTGTGNRSGTGTGAGAGAGAGGEKRAPTAIRVELAARATFRGEAVEVSGTVTAQGAEPGGLPIEVFLDGTEGLRVAQTTTAADGSWRAVLEVPHDVAVGDHRVIARTRGDERRAPSTSP